MALPLLVAGCLGGLGEETWYLVEAMETGGFPPGAATLDWSDVQWGHHEEALLRILVDAARDDARVQRPLDGLVWHDLHDRLTAASVGGDAVDGERQDMFWLTRDDGAYQVTFQAVSL